MRVSNGRAELGLAGDHPFVRYLGGCGREPHIDPLNVPLFARGEVIDQDSVADKLTGQVNLRKTARCHLRDVKDEHEA